MFCTLSEALSRIHDGDSLGISKFNPCRAVFELVGKGRKDLRLTAVPTAGFGADILAAGGALASIETGALVIAGYGTTPNVVRKIDSGDLRFVESSCPVLELQLLAGMSGLSFTHVPGLFDTDLLKRRDDLKVIQDPYDPDWDVILAPAVRPDVALIHGFRADPEGNVVISSLNEDRQLIKAAKRVLVTVEEVREGAAETLAEYEEAVSGIFLDAIAVVPGGARPFGCPGYYDEDAAAIRAWLAAAGDPQAMRAHLDGIIADLAGEGVDAKSVA